MKHFILQSILTLGLAFVAGAAFATDLSALEPADEPLAPAPQVAAALDDAAPVSLAISGRNVRVTGAQNCTLEVFDITGKCVMSVRVESNDKSFTLTMRKGWYIVRVGKVTRKVLLP